MLELEPLPSAMQESPSIRLQNRQVTSRDRDRSTALRLWPILVRRWWQVLLLAVVLGGVAGRTIFKKFAMNYKAEASMMVQPIMPRVMFMTEESRAQASSSYYDEYLHTLTRLFLERRVLAPAIKNLAEDKVAWLPTDLPVTFDAVDALRARISVDLVRNTRLITISARDPVPEVAATMVNEVVKSFLYQLNLEESLESDAKVQTLTNEYTSKQKELAELYVQLDKLTEKLGSAALDARQNVYYDRTSSLNEPLNKACLERLRAEAEEASAQQSIQLLKRALPDELIRRSLDADTDLRDMRALVERQGRELTISTAALGAEHPLKVRGEQQLSNLKARLEKMTVETRERIASGMQRERRDEAERLAIEARAKREAAAQVEESMRKSMNVALMDLSEFGKAQVETGKLKIKIDRLTESAASVEKRIEQLRIEARAPGRVSLRNEAETQPDSVNKLAWLVAAAGVLAGVVGSIVVIAGLDHLLPSLSNGRDLSKFGVNALAATRVPKESPEAWIELASRLALLSGSGMGAQILAPDGLADPRAQALMTALSQLGRRIVILDHDPKLGNELFRESTGNVTRLRLNLATSCGFSRNVRDLAVLERDAFLCAVLPLTADALLVQDLSKQSLVPVILATPTRGSAMALGSLSAISKQTRLIGAVIS